jgi:hypothetical protein
MFQEIGEHDVSLIKVNLVLKLSYPFSQITLHNDAEKIVSLQMFALFYFFVNRFDVGAVRNLHIRLNNEPARPIARSVMLIKVKTLFREIFLKMMRKKFLIMFLDYKCP